MLTKKDTSNIQYEEYSDETKYDFVDQVNNHTIPVIE